MIFYLLSAIALGLFLFLVGYGLAYFFEPSPTFKSVIPSSIFVGFTFVLFISWLKGVFSIISPQIYIVLLFIPFTLTSIIGFRTRAIWRIKQTPLRRLATPVYSILSGMVMAFPMSSGLFTTDIRFRTGPDLLGWGISSRYLQLHNSINFLKDSIKSQLSISSLDASFQTSDPSTSIYRLSSYQEQVSAEFLLASKRIGLQSFVGSVGQLFQNFNSVFIIWSLVCLFYIVASYILISYLSRSNLPISVKSLILITSLFAPSLIMPILEGGIWHIIAFTLLLFSITVLIENKNEPNVKLFFLPPILIFSLTLTLNTDLLIVFLPFLILWFTELKRKLLKNTIVILVISIVVHAPMVQSLFQSLQNRSKDAFVGGWPAARLPFPSDIFGLTAWHEARGFLNSEKLFSIWSIILRVIISGLLILILRHLSNKNKKFLSKYFIPILAFYGYFLIDFYVNDKVLTYIPWKLAFVIIAISPFMIEMVYKDYVSSANLSLKTNKNSNKARAFQQNSKRTDRASLLVIIISILIVLQFMRVQFDWEEFSTTNSLVSKGTTILYNEDDLDLMELDKVDIIGSCIPWFQSVALVSDLRLIAQRVNGVTPNPSVPHRDSVYLINPKLESCKEFIKETDTGIVIYKSPAITLLKK